MFQKQRPGYGRSRTPRRELRRAPTAVDDEAARVAAARRVATSFVASHWPELARVAPAVALRPAGPPSPELLARLGLDGAELTQPAIEPQYTFIFSGARSAADCGETPLVASVTVDTHQRIVKTSVTR